MHLYISNMTLLSPVNTEISKKKSCFLSKVLLLHPQLCHPIFSQVYLRPAMSLLLWPANTQKQKQNLKPNIFSYFCDSHIWWPTRFNLKLTKSPSFRRNRLTIIVVDCSPGFLKLFSHCYVFLYQLLGVCGTSPIWKPE